jgi:hypothetical protein
MNDPDEQPPPSISTRDAQHAERPSIRDHAAYCDDTLPSHSRNACNGLRLDAAAEVPGRQSVSLSSRHKETVMRDNDDAIQQLDRTPSDKNTTHETIETNPAWRDEAWLARFDEQLTEEVIGKLHDRAEQRAFAVEAAGKRVDSFYWRALVQDAIADTWIGLLRWDPERGGLYAHLWWAIQSRTRDDREHALAHPHDPIWQGDDDEVAQAAAEETERQASTQDFGTPDAETSLYAREVLVELRDAAKEDKAVLRLLDAYEAGATRREDVVAHAKMREATYHKARIRLGRLAQSLIRQTLGAKARA